MQGSSIAWRLADATEVVVSVFRDRPVHRQGIVALYPTIYRATHVRRYNESLTEGRLCIFGMNPGPNGMGQSGLGFIDLPIQRAIFPDEEGTPPERTATRHRLADPLPDPERVGRWSYDRGLGNREEDSGQRLWRGLIAATKSEAMQSELRAGSVAADYPAMASRVCMFNVCPVLYLDADGNNVSFSDKQKRLKLERAHYDAMARYVEQVVRIVKPRAIVAAGDWAAQRVTTAIGSCSKILHPSPATGKSELQWRNASIRTLQRGLGV